MAMTAPAPIRQPPSRCRTRSAVCVKPSQRKVPSRQALQATESRYQELFTRIPTPLVLHDQGRVLDANPAALDHFVALAATR